MEEDSALSCFSALSSPTRLRMMKCLVQSGPEGMIAGDIARAVEAAPSRASFHLSALAQTGLVSSRKTDRRIVYCANLQAMGNLMRYILQDCCGNDPTVLSCCVHSPDCSEP